MKSLKSSGSLDQLTSPPQSFLQHRSLAVSNDR
jgi:hypothetical protein